MTLHCDSCLGPVQALLQATAPVQLHSQFVVAKITSCNSKNWLAEMHKGICVYNVVKLAHRQANGRG